MKRYTRFALWLAVAAVAALAAFCILLVVENWSSRRTAESLLRYVRSVKVGETTLADVKPILDRKGWEEGGLRVSPPRCAGPTYSTGTGTPQLFWSVGLWIPGLMRWLVSVGFIRVWGATTNWVFEEGKLCEIYFRITVLGFRGESVGWEIRESTIARRAYDYHPLYFGDNYYVVINPVVKPWIRSLWVRLTPQATAQERQLAFDVDLSCLTSFGGCKKLCKVMPSAWRDSAVRFLKANPGFHYEDEYRRDDLDLDDPDCPAREDHNQP